MEEPRCGGEKARGKSPASVFLCIPTAGGRNPGGVKNPVVLSETQRGALRRALAAFDYGSQSRGREYWRRGAVRELRVLDDGTTFEADVQGSTLYTVEWSYGKGWEHACDCPVGFACKHAYAAALAALGDGASATIPGVFSGALLVKPSAPTEPPEVQQLEALLEQRHGRPLTRKERGFLRELDSSWRRLGTTGTLYEHDLVVLELDRRQGYFHNPNPVIAGWWDGAEPVASPLEFWQFLALYAERREIPIPELMRPLTDTALVRRRVETRERRQQVANWHRLFSERSQAFPVAPVSAVPAEVRLRLTTPKLTWEARANAEEPWQAVKGGRVREWFETAAHHPAGLPPASLALLQEVQLRCTRTNYWKSTEPQTLKLDDPTTLDLMRWILVQPAMRHLLVNAAGEAFDPDPVPLRWFGRSLPDRPDDISFDLRRTDDSPAPTDLLELSGDPPLALAGHVVFALPPPLPGHGYHRVVVPREALLTPAAARHLRQTEARLEGLDLPAIEVVRLRPRFLCRLRDDEYSPPGSLNVFEVEAHAVAPTAGRCNAGRATRGRH